VTSTSAKSWAAILRYRRLSNLGAASWVLAMVLFAVAPEATFLIGAAAAVGLGLIVWAPMGMSHVQCPHCRYRLNSHDGLYWRRCRHCNRSLTEGAA
jgi:hypothetical protein